MKLVPRKDLVAAATLAAASALLLFGVASGLVERDLGAARLPDVPLPVAEPLGGPPPPVASYTLTARLDPEAHVVDGQGTITLRNVSSQPLDEVWVHLYLNAFEDEHTVFRRFASRGSRGEKARGDGHIEVSRFALRAEPEPVDVWPKDATTPGDPHDRTNIQVALPHPIEPGQVAVFDVAWRATLPPVQARTGHGAGFHMVAQWFPKLAKLEPDGRFVSFPFEPLSEFYADFGDYDVTIDVPRGTLVGATGKRVEANEADGRLVVRHTQRGVHDFAFAAWDEFAEQRIAHRGVELISLVPRGMEASGRLQLALAARSLDVFGARFGSYPFETLTLVQAPRQAAEANGMEYPTLVTTGGRLWRGWLGLRDTDGVTVHEIGHQWFQGLLASNENAYPFLDEGLNTWASDLGVMPLLRPKSSLLGLGSLRIDALGAHRALSVEAAQRVPVATAAGDFPTRKDYGAIAYARTGTVLATVDRVFDGAALRAIGRYARAHRFGHPTPDDLYAAFHDEGGPRLAALVEGALEERGWVDFAVDEVRTASLPDERRRGEVVVSRRGTLVMPVDVIAVEANGRRHRLTWDGEGPHAVLTVDDIEGDLVRAELDPDGRVVIDHALLNNARSNAPRASAPRVRLESAYAAALLHAALTP